MHRRILSTLAAAGIASALAGTALAQDAGWYADLRGGVVAADTMRFAQPTTANLTLDPKTGWALEGAVGYRFAEPFRIEIAAGYQRSKLNGTFRENVQVTIPCGTVSSQPCLAPNVSGTVKAPSVFAMAYYTLPLNETLSLSLGGGVGALRYDLDVNTVGRLNNGTSSRFDIIAAEDTVFAGRGTAELAYNLGNAAVTLGYTYTATEKPALAGRGAFIPFTFDKKLSAHQFMTGIRLTF